MRRGGRGGELRGRDGELASVDAVLASALDGRGASVFVEGPAGIGKSRFVGELLERARRDGFRTFAARAEELDRLLPFSSLIEAFGLRDPLGDEKVAGISRLLAGRTDHGRGAELGFAIQEAIVDYVEHLANVPVLVAIDDAHVADPSTIAVLRALGRRTGRLPIVVVSAFRPAPRPAELDALVEAGIESGAPLIRLAPLPPDACTDLATDLLDARPAGTLEERVAAAGGNPLFVVELLRSLLASGSVRVVDGRAEADASSLPTDLRAAVLRRLRTLDESIIDLLRVAAVLGPRFSIVDLSTVTARSSIDLLPALRTATHAGILVEDGERMAFAHALLRDAIYEDLAQAMRTALHRHAAETLACRRDASPIHVAEHILAAGGTGDGSAVDWLRRAAKETVTSSPVSALELLDRALEIADAEDRDDLDADRLMPLLWSGRIDEAVEVSRRLAERAGGVPAHLRARLAFVMLVAGRFEEAIEQIDGVDLELDDRSVAVLRAQAALALATVARTDEAESAAADALRVGLSLDDAAVIAEARAAQGVVALIRGRTEEAVSHAQEAVEIAARAQSAERRARNHGFFLGLALLDADRRDDAMEAFHASRRRVGEVGHVWDLPLHHVGLALCHVRAGDWDDALAEAHAAIEASEELGTSLGAPWPFGIIATIQVHRNDLAGAERTLRQADLALERSASILGYDWAVGAKAILHEARGELDEALAVFVAMWDGFRAGGLAGRQWAVAPDVVRLAIATGSVDRATACVTELRTLERCTTPTPMRRATMLRCDGLVRADARMLLEAVTAYDGCARAVDAAAALEEAGKVQAGEGAAGDAAVTLGRALDAYERIGATLDVARTRAALRKLGVRRSGRSPRRGRSGWDALTPTELEVVKLLGEGLSNPEIGERLYISRRTVGTHLAHVYQKLGVNSRVQVAAMAARRRGG